MTIDTCEVHQYEQLNDDGECPKCVESGSSTCSLSRWPTVEEVRENYPTKGTGWAYAVVTGFRDYGPVVAKFYVVHDGQEVWVDFPDGLAHGPAEALRWDEGQTLRFLCVANDQV